MDERIALCKIKDGFLKVEDAENAALLLKKCSNISKTEKIGWKIIDDISTIDEQLYTSYGKEKSYETVVEHIYECYLIGLLYLPAKSTELAYDKQKILNMILIHDLGECHTGDYPPFYDHIDEIKESESIFNKGLFINGVHNGIADLTDYLRLWKEWENDSPDINVRIAKDLDKIHMIYKMLKLLNETDLPLKKERIQKFLAERKTIKTEEGKKIFEMIIIKNKEYKELINRYLSNIEE